MQVADIQAAATSATLGAQQTQSVGMVEDAAFLMMLSANLYSNQNLACIREPLCNAWDAHVEAGRTDLPVRITITASHELIIQDSGHGIPDDKIVQIYGTYGQSTKRTNNKVTGGFGLGSKSPWAYTESFRVISENQGKKVIYNMVRSSVEADGRPAITKVMELPTDRCGLTVMFQLRDSDVEEMVKYIRYVAMHGDMNVLFMREGHFEQPTQLPTLNLDTATGSYDVDHSRWYNQYMGQHSLFVRYGAVVYPMLQTPGTQKAVNLLKEFMELVGFSKMVVQAEPGTLALTPSREALSSQKMTEDGITDLCVALVARIEEDIIRQIPASILQAVEVLKKCDSYYTGLENYRSTRDVISPMSVRKYLASPLGAAKWAKYTAMLDHAENRGFRNGHTFTNKAATREYHRLRTRLNNASRQTREAMKFTFAKQYVLRPVSRVFLKNPQLKPKEFFHANHFYYGNSNRQHHWMEHVEVELFDLLKQLVDTPTVFLTTRTKNLRKSLECCPWVTHGKATWVYRVTPKEDRAPIIKAFEDSGMKVIDLTLNHDWDDAAAELEAERMRRNATRKVTSGTLPGIEAKKQPNLLMSLSNVYDDEGNRKMDTYRIKAMKDVAEMSNTPLFYIEVDSVSKVGDIGAFAHYLDLTNEERKHGVIVRNGIEKNMAIKRGAKNTNAYFAPKLWARLHSKAFQDYCTKFRKDALFDQLHLREDHIELLDYLGIKLPGFNRLVTDAAMERDWARMKLLSGSSFHSYMPELTQTQHTHYVDVVRAYKLADTPSTLKLKALREDPLIQRLFSGSNTVDWIRKYPDRKAALKSLVMSALKNGNKDE